MRDRTLSYLVAAAVFTTGPAAAQTGSKKASQPSQPAGPQPILRANFIAQMDAQFAKIDADENGQLARLEIEQFEQEKALTEAKVRNEALFDQLDVNDNGQISAAEFTKLTTVPPPSAQPMLSREDSNRDGQISLFEHRAATLANFDRIDGNKDGVVTPAEMKAMGVVPR